MLATLPEFRFLAERVDLIAHLVESAIDALPFGLDILCHDLIEQRDVFDSARITRLAIALDDYWDAL